jgi:hypothetical protein
MELRESILAADFKEEATSTRAHVIRVQEEANSNKVHASKE